MTLPYFFTESIKDVVQLDEDTSKHVINVLRMQKDEHLLLTDGKGTKAEAKIVDDNRKRCTVQIISTQKEEPRKRKITIAVSLLKNASRFEWFLEKATEIGVTEIIPLICDRTEKEKFRHERMQSILISAMLQSQQSWLPVLHQPTDFSQAIHLPFQQKLIAHCLPEQKQQLMNEVDQKASSQIILIGPEGDFTTKEVEAALQHNFVPVALGETRLRTETAGMVAATLLRMKGY